MARLASDSGAGRKPIASSDEDIRRARQARELAAQLSTQKTAKTEATKYMGEAARLGFPGVPAEAIAPTAPTSPVNVPSETSPSVTGPTDTGATGPTGTGATGPINPVDQGMTQDEVTQALADFYAKIQEDALAQKRKASESAYGLLYDEFSRMGLGSLVQPLQRFIQEGISDAEFTLRLRETDAYKKRFAANAQRVAKGLAALSEADYVDLEDRYQTIMRQYGLPESYYKRGDLGRQESFEKLIAGDVRDDELADRLNVAYNRVLNAAPQIKESLKQFYPDITNGDILAYTLDPEKAILDIKRKVTAAEIGAGAAMAGLGTTRARAEELGALGVTGEQAREKFQTIAGYLPRASQLGDIYAKQGMGPFTQTTAEAEVFGTTGAAEAAQKRRKLSELETAQFSGQVGASGGALSRERAGQF